MKLNLNDEGVDMSNLFETMTTDNLLKLKDRLEQAIELSRSCSIDLLERHQAVEEALTNRL